jgi:lysine decarboxylase
VFLGDPSYAGALGDVAGQAEVAHEHGLPLLVDAAWAPHFGFHPDLPQHALARGADAVVTSAHKTLPAVSQGALVLARTEWLDAARLDRAVEATATTSPAGAILASIDASRALLQHHGPRLLGNVLRLVDDARNRLSAVPGLATVAGRDVDPTKLVVLLAGTGAHGREVEQELVRRGLPVEMADRDTLVPIVTAADDDASVSALVDGIVAGVQDSVARSRTGPRALSPSVVWTVEPRTVVAPREAFFARHTTVDASAAAGRVSAELVAPYPPGIPVLAPGELVTEAVLDALRAAAADGARIAYAADASLQTLQVLA